MEKKKKKGSLQGVLWLAAMVLVGFVCGFFAIQHIDLSFMEGLSIQLLFLTYVLFFVLIWLAYFLQTIVHEAGHLVFGLLSGYRFSSFRVSSLMLLKKGGKYTFKKYTLAGTGGQCLMIPPAEDENGKSPLGLFLWGGAIFNLLCGGIFLLLTFLTRELAWVSLFCGMSAMFAFFGAILNGVPMKTDLVANDGANAISLRKNPDAAREFCRHLLINAQIVEGARLRDMPNDWFAFPNDEQLKNNAFAETAVFACNRLMDEMRFAEAEERMRYLLDADSAMVGVHRRLLICDLMYCELIGQCRGEVLGEMYDKEQMKFMRSMQNFPSVIRTEYAYAKLFYHDSKKAQVNKDAFEKMAKSYPNEGDIFSERELIAYVDTIAKEA